MTNAAPGWYPDPTQVDTQRYWNGVSWTPQTSPLVRTARGNGAATAAVVFGILGFLLTPIPLFVGLLLGGPLDVLAIVFGITGMVKGSARGGVGVGRSVVGLVLGGLMFLAIFTGAGTIW